MRKSVRPTVRASRHVFGCVTGYTTLAASGDISPSEREELEQLSFGQTNNTTFLDSLSAFPSYWCRPLQSERYAVTRVLKGALDDKNRSTLLLLTAVFSPMDWVLKLRGDVNALMASPKLWAWNGQAAIDPVIFHVPPSTAQQWLEEQRSHMIAMLRSVESLYGKGLVPLVTSEEDFSPSAVGLVSTIIPHRIKPVFSFAARSLSDGLPVHVNCLSSCASRGRSSRKTVTWSPKLEANGSPFADDLALAWDPGEPPPWDFIAEYRYFADLEGKKRAEAARKRPVTREPLSESSTYELAAEASSSTVDRTATGASSPTDARPRRSGIRVALIAVLALLFAATVPIVAFKISHHRKRQVLFKQINVLVKAPISEMCKGDDLKKLREEIDKTYNDYERELHRYSRVDSAKEYSEKLAQWKDEKENELGTITTAQEFLKSARLDYLVQPESRGKIRNKADGFITQLSHLGEEWKEHNLNIETNNKLENVVAYMGEVDPVLPDYDKLWRGQRSVYILYWIASSAEERGKLSGDANALRSKLYDLMYEGSADHTELPAYRKVDSFLTFVKNVKPILDEASTLVHEGSAVDAKPPEIDTLETARRLLNELQVIQEDDAYGLAGSSSPDYYNLLSWYANSVYGRVAAFPTNYPLDKIVAEIASNFLMNGSKSKAEKEKEDLKEMLTELEKDFASTEESGRGTEIADSRSILDHWEEGLKVCQQANAFLSMHRSHLPFTDYVEKMRAVEEFKKDLSSYADCGVTRIQDDLNTWIAEKNKERKRRDVMIAKAKKFLGDREINNSAMPDLWERNLQPLRDHYLKDSTDDDTKNILLNLLHIRLKVACDRGRNRPLAKILQAYEQVLPLLARNRLSDLSRYIDTAGKAFPKNVFLRRIKKRITGYEQLLTLQSEYSSMKMSRDNLLTKLDYDKTNSPKAVELNETKIRELENVERELEDKRQNLLSKVGEWLGSGTIEMRGEEDKRWIQETSGRLKKVLQLLESKKPSANVKGSSKSKELRGPTESGRQPETESPLTPASKVK